MEKLEIAEVVMCALWDCLACAPADEAIWDEETDQPYCTSRHMQEAFQNKRQLKLIEEPDDFPFDDPRSEGYVSLEDAQRNYLETVEAYDVYYER